jgi:hypothetical protein
MTGKGSDFVGNDQGGNVEGSRSPDIRVAKRSSWLLAAMIIASVAALLATSDPEKPRHSFATSVVGPQAELTSAAPNVTYRITVIATALAPEGGDTSQYAQVKVHGSIATPLAPTDSQPFVTVKLGNPADAGTSTLQALTSFDVSSDLQFFGSCAHPDVGAPCQAQVLLTLARDDAGASGGSLGVAWTASFDTFTTKESGPDVGPTAPPWTIDVVAQ